MKKFTVEYKNGHKHSFMVRGICRYDILNPCWDNRSTDIPGKHWGDPENDACDRCTKVSMS